MELNLKDKVAIVTGGNRGIGAGVARQLAREGMRLALVARDGDKLTAMANALRESSDASVLTIACDLREREAAASVIERTLARFGHLDLLVNNAGATRRGDFFELTDDDWEDGLALKLHGYVRMTRAAWPQLANTQGTVVNIVGVGAWTGIGEFTIGGVVNAGLMNFTKAMADLGKRDGVRVCAVNPGRIRTDRLERNIARIAQNEGVAPEVATQMLLNECGINRFGSPDEIGQAVAFMASDAASFAQGAILDIDGGETRAI
ncbi:3-oxoacyl-[acyl-carrier protein] reductase [Paraburkholderia steynii]|uniref:3-oxoacyl-[acyl-carrier protein] reductase n=2 Tax=Paraburkholderia TaxID=1822464 RepID=A0A7Z7B7J9_9BURK|nr:MULTISPECIES: SDR family oxidoreductase [Paraburkholderia]BCZ82810.1 short-chain dehydrogenase [Paraburkholderia terrae]BDC43890.1 short-chain dehydrogenase [Paraburkholderia terrae]SDH87095.1 3-oxoacyl-[acyl-carrier protein] reductase [Paraburkholderia steynii]